MTSDPLDDLVRRTVGQVQVPAGLEDRIRRSAALRRLTRWAVAGLAAAGLVLLWPRSNTVEPTGTGPVFSLREPAPAALEMKPVAFTTEVRSGPEGVAFRFTKGGSRDE
jgi:hypothetical protein